MTVAATSTSISGPTLAYFVAFTTLDIFAQSVHNAYVANTYKNQRSTVEKQPLILTRRYQMDMSPLPRLRLHLPGSDSRLFPDIELRVITDQPLQLGLKA